MKKKLFWLFCLFIISGCAKNEVVLTEFLTTANNNGYILEENMTGYENYHYIQKIYYAINRENAYDIQFLELESDDYAKKFYDINKKELMNYVDDSTYIKNLNYSNYSVYHIENDVSYMLVLRSKNNIIYLEAPIEYFQEIEDFFKELSLDF